MGKSGGSGRRRPAPLAIAAAAAAAIAATALFLIPKAPLRIGFYDVDGDLAASVSKVVDAWAARSGTKASGSMLGRLDAASLRGVDAAFLYPSAANEPSAGGFAPIPEELGARVSIPLRRSWCLPLLADTLELDWRKDLFGKEPASGRFGASALAAAAKAAKGKAATPLILMGGDDARLLDAAGLLVLAKGGIAAYGRLAALPRKAGADAALGADLAGFDLKSALEPLAALRNDGLLHPDWLDFKPGAAAAFVAEGLAALSLQSLSTRRRVPRGTGEKTPGSSS